MLDTYLSSKRIDEREDLARLQRRRRRRTRKYIFRISILALLLVAVFSHFTNPFVGFSLVADPNHVEKVGNEIVREDVGELLVAGDPVSVNLAYLKSGWHIVSSRYFGGKMAKSHDVEGIIAEIHQKRFDPEWLFLISGDHFSVFYPRSLGVFYNTIMDSRTALNQQDWDNRQMIYLKTLAYALEVYDKTPTLSTTVVPISKKTVVPINFYAYPSDTLYSMLYAMQELVGQSEIKRLYPFSSQSPEYTLSTQAAAQKLKYQYGHTLVRHYNRYLLDAYDPKTGLIKTEMRLSSSKDITKRYGAFYDNVVLWKTVKLMQDLGLVEPDPQWLFDFKQRIIKNYWLENEGFFVEEKSEKNQDRRYSSDWLIAMMTGFLDPNNPQELEYLQRSVKYIWDNGLDLPFGLQMQAERDGSDEYRLVRMFSNTYGTVSIWSHWGMEYVKLLVRLYQVTGKEIYLSTAKQQIQEYTLNIRRFRGYPEVYGPDGDFFKQIFHQSVRQTGWVVNYEQAREMLDSTVRQIECGMLNVEC